MGSSINVIHHVCVSCIHTRRATNAKSVKEVDQVDRGQNNKNFWLKCRHPVGPDHFNIKWTSGIIAQTCTDLSSKYWTEPRLCLSMLSGSSGQRQLAVGQHSSAGRVLHFRQVSTRIAGPSRWRMRFTRDGTTSLSYLQGYKNCKN